MTEKSQLVYTDLSLTDALTLTITQPNGDRVSYEVAQFSSSWAMNEIPTAVCMLAIGREGNTLTPATINSANLIWQMQPVEVVFHPQQSYSPTQIWPDAEQLIFSGYFVGFTYRKINGKVYVIANLLHWLAALAMSSCLTQNGHVANPTAMNARAVLESLTTAGSAQGVYATDFTTVAVVSQSVKVDFWGAVKVVFCALANTPALQVSPPNTCGGDGTYSFNSTALNALQMIEGQLSAFPGKCDMSYKWGVPLKMITNNVPSMNEAVALAVGRQTVSSLSGVSFWDKLVGQYCPQFGLAVVPMVNSAIVIADTPALAGPGGPWVVVEADEYDSFEMTAELHRPLRGVGVVTRYVTQMLANQQKNSNAQFITLGGCYTESSVAPGDGMVQYISPPYWIESAASMCDYVFQTIGLGRKLASKTATQPGAQIPQTLITPDSFGVNIAGMCNLYAQDYYVNSMLRGRGGNFSGKLRFDIAPGSIIQVSPKQELALGGEDILAFPIFGCVSRVTITINAEATMAGTAFSLTHIRTDAEYGANRTSVFTHPLFGNSIHGCGLHGSPLIDAYAFRDALQCDM